jgi:hypothetical protein
VTTPAGIILVVEDEAGTRSVVPFADDAIVVGRAAEGVTFRLTDRDVSRRHARFLRLNGAVFVEDLGSLTGTRVNGERISGRRRLRDGDLVQIGDYDLALLAEGTALAGAPPPPLPPARVETTAVTQKLPSLPDVPLLPDVPSLSIPMPAPPPRGRGMRLLLAAGLVVLGVALAAAIASGALDASSVAPVTRP